MNRLCPFPSQGVLVLLGASEFIESDSVIAQAGGAQIGEDEFPFRGQRAASLVDELGLVEFFQARGDGDIVEHRLTPEASSIRLTPAFPATPGLKAAAPYIGVISVSADGLAQKPNALFSGFDIAFDKARRCDIVYVVAQLERLTH